MEQFGVKRDRAEVLGIAALVFATVARQLGIAQARSRRASASARRVLLELAETAREEQAKAEGAHDKALLTAARSFANRVDHDTTHGEHVRLLARALFHQLRDVHGVPDDRGVLLEVAALLHDVGEVVNQRGHHKHSEYMIRWGRIPGLDDTGREMVALMARCHRKDAARAKELINELAAAEGAARASCASSPPCSASPMASTPTTARASSRSCARGWATRSCSISSSATARRATTPSCCARPTCSRTSSASTCASRSRAPCARPAPDSRELPRSARSRHGATWNARARPLEPWYDRNECDAPASLP